MTRAMTTALAAGLLATALVGCATGGGGGAGPAENGSATSPEAAPPGAGRTSAAGEPSAPAAAAAAGVTVDIRIANGSVEPTNATYDATIGEPIVLVVDSDAADELHVHSSPERSFEIAAAADQRFEFTVDVPGSVAVELHDLDRTVATFNVRP